MTFTQDGKSSIPTKRNQHYNKHCWIKPNFRDTYSIIYVILKLLNHKNNTLKECNVTTRNKEVPAKLPYSSSTVI